MASGLVPNTSIILFMYYCLKVFSSLIILVMCEVKKFFIKMNMIVVAIIANKVMIIFKGVDGNNEIIANGPKIKV